MNSIPVQPSPTIESSEMREHTKFDAFSSLNNMGVILLCDRQYNQAASCFNEALSIASHRLFSESAPPASSTGNNTVYGSSTSCISTGTTTVRTFYLLFNDKVGDLSSQQHYQQHHVNDSASPLQGKGGDTYVFCHPLVVSESIPTTANRAPTVEAHFSNLSSICFYNLALTFHLASLDRQYIGLGATAIGTSTTTTTGPTSVDITEGKKQYPHFAREILGQALFYYEIAYRILVSDQDVLVYQAMVILNNLGQVHLLMNDEVTATNCFQHLLTTMVYLQQAGEADRIHHWDSFFSNVLGLISAQPGPAPAA
jgi:hypothetical protein